MPITPPSPPTPDSGGIHIGDVGGSVNFSALGDIVGGDKITTITTTIQISVEAVTQRPLITASPYRGLDRFEDRDKDLFFGRDQLIKSLLAQLSASNVLLVLGASGSGKSSVVRAGLLPQLAQLIGARFRYFTFVPDVNPFESLRSALQGAGFSQTQTRELADARPETPAKLIHTLQRSDDQWLVFVDQFEEIFTVGDEKLRANFIAALVAIAQDPSSSTKLVLAMRADFLDRFSPFPQFAKIVEKNIDLVADMHADELRQAIEQPAARHGVVFEQGLVEEIIKDVQGQAGSLPLLQYTLDLLWQEEAREDGLADRHLNTKSYRELGGVRGALQKRANEIYASFGDGGDANTANPRQEIVRQIFLRLVDLAGEGSNDAAWRPVRRRASMAMFTAAQQQEILQALINQKLLVSNREGDDATVEVAHEALFASWGRLKNWIEAGKQVIFAKNRLADDTRRWQRRQQEGDRGADEELLSGSRLAQALDMRARGDFATVIGGLGDTENLFLDRSAAQREKRARLRRVLEVAGAALLVISIVGAIFGWIGQRNAAAKAKEAQRALAMSYVTRAEESDQKGNGPAALAFLASATELEPDSAAAADRLWFILTQRFWPRPLGVPMRGEGVTSVIAFSRDGSRIAVGSTDGTVRLWDTSSSRAIAVPERHQKIVFSASFSPDQTRFVTASRDGTARIWSAKDGQPITPWLRHDDAVLCAAFSGDSQLLATGSTDKRVRTWKTIDGSLVGIPLIHDTEVSAVAFSPSDPTILLSGAGKMVRLWSHATGEPGHPLPHPGAVLSVEFDPGGKRILTACNDGVVREWETASGQTVLEVTRSSETLDRAFYSPDARTIVVIAGQSLRIWSRGSNEPFALNAGARVRRAAFSSDGARLISGTDNGHVQMWGADSGAAIGEPIRESRQIEGLAFAKDGHILLGTNQGTCRLWAAPSGLLPAARLAHQHAVESALLSTDGERLLTYGTGATIWKLRDNKAVWRLPQGYPPVRQVAWSHDGSHFVTVAGDQVQLWQTATGAALGRPMSFDADISIAAFRPDGRTLAVGTARGAITFHSVADGQRFGLPMDHTARVSAVAWSPDSTQCFTTSWDGRIKVWNADSGHLVREVDTSEEVACAAVSRDGQRLVTGGASGAIRIWNATTLSRVEETHQQRRITACVFSPDGSTLATASDDGTAAVWDSRTGKARFQLAPHSARNSDSMTSVSFSVDGRRLATGSADGSAIVWDAQTGRQLSEPLRHSDSITSVAFNPKGDRLITSALDRRVCLWDVQTPGGRAERKAIARFARTIIPVKLSPLGHLERQELDFPQNHAGAAPASLKKLIEWFYGDRFTRAVSPFSMQSVQNAIAELLSENRPESLREAAVLASGDSQLEEKMRKLMMQTPEN